MGWANNWGGLTIVPKETGWVRKGNSLIKLKSMRRGVDGYCDRSHISDSYFQSSLITCWQYCPRRNVNNSHVFVISTFSLLITVKFNLTLTMHSIIETQKTLELWYLLLRYMGSHYTPSDRRLFPNSAKCSSRNLQRTQSFHRAHCSLPTAENWKFRKNVKRRACTSLTYLRGTNFFVCLKTCPCNTPAMLNA